MNNVQFGEHVIFDAYGCEFVALNSKKVCLKVLNDLVKLTNMTKLTEPIVVNAKGNEVLGGKDPGGFTGFVAIKESHISVHTFAKRGFVTIDIYSCKKINSEKAIEYLKKTFKPKDFDVLKIGRGLKYPKANIY